ncbi:universal stress protein [Lysobacter sp. A6]|uniref:Universal stress protein n=1 Tax=Noviluteimonas lactosilytica TaxID=2888523 RepID=A0ABS8JM23_9GAMM|nr:universal stress protein [Lysobacter lactosilyticus]MCC8364670.1 universal stress protein [Lysobacter lactosilyticus]
MIRDLLVPITRATTDDAVVAFAEKLAIAYSAKLIVSIPAAVPAVMAAPWGFAPGAVLVEVLEGVEQEAMRHAERLRAHLAKSEASVDVRVDRTRIFDPAEALTMQARYADLAVLARPTGDDAAITHAFFDAFLFGSGRPLLTVPVDKPAARESRFQKIMLAWKPTRESARAIHDAIALFEPTDVEVLIVDPEIGDLWHGDEPGADIGAHLAEHGLRVNVSRRPAGSMSVATTVLLHAAENDVDLIVAGGYGHTRMREWVLGGATRELLEGMDKPVLFSH